jgi:AraC-like DNA-binding protein
MSVSRLERIGQSDSSGAERVLASPHERSDAPVLSRVAGDYHERLPSEPLRQAVRCVWKNELRPSGRPLLVVPDGCIDLLWTGSALLVAGPDTGPVIEAVPSDAVIVGLRFQPGAALTWIDVPAAEVTNRRLPLTELWGRDARLLEDELTEVETAGAAIALLERSLMHRMRLGRAPNGLGLSLTHELGRRALMEESDVRGLAAAVGVSERTLRRRCDEMFGYGPRTFARILRFQRFMALVLRRERRSLSALAMACGYSDQAHLSREARRLSGLTPGMVVAQLTRQP